MFEVMYRGWDGKQLLPRVLYTEWVPPRSSEMYGVSLPGHYRAGMSGVNILDYQERIWKKDAKENDVYVGDVISWSYGCPMPEWGTGLQDFFARVVRINMVQKGDLDGDTVLVGFGIKFSDGGETDLPEEFVVVGNIYENPELVEGWREEEKTYD